MKPNAGIIKYFFIDGSVDTKETFLELVLWRFACADGNVAFAIASLEIDAWLLQKSRLTHSLKFIIPMDVDSTFVCNVKHRMHIVEVLQNCKLTLWDEVPMMYKFSFELAH